METQKQNCFLYKCTIDLPQWLQSKLQCDKWVMETEAYHSDTRWIMNGHDD
jgi:hypothetical protein